MYFDLTNVLNQMQSNKPALNILSPGSWGVLGGGGNLQGNNYDSARRRHRRVDLV